jgi:hypothetical protein
MNTTGRINLQAYMLSPPQREPSLRLGDWILLGVYILGAPVYNAVLGRRPQH